MVRRRAAHRRGHRLHDQPVARRRVDQPLRHGAEPRGDGARRTHAGDRLVGARSEAADDGRVHRAQARLRVDLGGRPRRPTTHSMASPRGSTRSTSGVPGRTGRWSRTPTGTAATTASTASSSACSPTPTRWSRRSSVARSTPPTTSRRLVRATRGRREHRGRRRPAGQLHRTGAQRHGRRYR